jgi:hypothetical protein
MSPSIWRKLAALTLVVGASVALVASCSANSSNSGFAGNAGNTSGGSSGADSAGGSGGGNGGSGGAPAGGSGGTLFVPEAGQDVVNETPINQCGSQCGPTELCDPQHLGYDDNCNGIVDEGCGCTPGLSHWCFKGDPASRNQGACKDGTETCNENGLWGGCIGGFHADAVDNCLNQGIPTGCHDLSVPPFTTVKLKDGTGTFGQGATGESFAVDCPPSIPGPNCPQVQNNGPDATYTPLQSGQYKVLYTKDDGSGGKASCTFSLYVGTTGLRVELNWDHQGEGEINHYTDPDGGSMPNTFGPDLDLHVHKPGVQSKWFMPLMPTGSPDDCFYADCTAANFAIAMPLGAPNWFNDNAYPHNWTYHQPYDPNDPIYTCYNAPRGAGQEWKVFNKGCHNPRLDLDNITCDKTKTDPQDPAFCAPENINIDEPPYGFWTRIGVHYYGHCYNGDLHPTVTIYCGGAQVAQLGPSGYNAPVTFKASDCQGDDAGGNAFWMVADVMAVEGPCGDFDCVVQPIYADLNTKAPYIKTGSFAKSNFGPGCAPGGDAGPGCF